MIPLHRFALLLAVITPAFAGNSGVRLDEIMAGLNGDSAFQFVELQVQDAAQRTWGPQGAEAAGRCQLVFTNGVGQQTGRYVFPHDPPAQSRASFIAC